MEACKEIERSIITKFRKEIWRMFIRAVKEYKLIEENDQLAVCISGGKDSFLLAKCIEEFQKHQSVKISVKYIVMDPGYSKKNKMLILENAKKLNINIDVFESDIFDSVANMKEKSACYLCARMRRGALYSYAKKLGCNKIVLGHHYDDVIETILLSMFYGGEIKTMMPKLHSENFNGIQLIRPLYLIREKDIKAWAKYNHLNFLNCACRFTETNNEGHSENSKRLEIKKLIESLNKKSIYIEGNIFKSVSNVNLDTLIEYKKAGIRHNFLDEYEDKDENK
ncbi:MAG: ATP-binding protein [Bacilli bacterium]